MTRSAAHAGSLQPLDRAQTGALGPPVGGHLVCTRPQRPAG